MRIAHSSTTLVGCVLPVALLRLLGKNSATTNMIVQFGKKWESAEGGSFVPVTRLGGAARQILTAHCNCSTSTTDPTTLLYIGVSFTLALWQQQQRHHELTPILFEFGKFSGTLTSTWPWIEQRTLLRSGRGKSQLPIILAIYYSCQTVIDEWIKGTGSLLCSHFPA